MVIALGSTSGSICILEFNPDSPEWGAQAQGYKIEALEDLEVHVEAIGGGGGGGGNHARDSGGGGQAGGYVLEPVKLKKGIYRVKIGQGGMGGWAYGAGNPAPKATSGSETRLFHPISGFDYITVASGGAAGIFNGVAGASGGKGGDVVNPRNGKVISTGGAGGVKDRPGKAGIGPGAGSGGCGVYLGQTDFQSENANHGRVTITTV